MKVWHIALIIIIIIAIVGGLAYWEIQQFSKLAAPADDSATRKISHF